MQSFQQVSVGAAVYTDIVQLTWRQVFATAELCSE